MELPPDVSDRIARHWSDLPPDVQDRLSRAGFAGGGSATTTTPTTTTPHPYAEGAGAFLGGLLPGPAGIATAGVGDVLARTAAEGRIPTATEALGAFGRGAGGQALGMGVGKALGAGARALGFGKTTAQQATEQGISGAAEKFGIPMLAGDVTLSKPTRMLENFPSYFAIGSGSLQKFRTSQVGAAGEAAQGLIAKMGGEQADALTAGLAAQGGVKTAVKAFRAQSQQLYNAIEHLAGPDPVVPTSNLKRLAASMVQQGEQTAVSAPGAASRLAGPLAEIPPEASQALHEALASETIPFATARQIEAQLGELAFKSKAPGAIGTIRQGQYAALYRAVRSDLDEYLTSPAGAEVSPALAEAKQVYATGKELFNNSVSKLVLGGKNSPVSPEKVIDRVFRPGAITDTLDFKLAVSDDVYQQATQTWLDGLYQKASASGVFQPTTFAREIGKYAKNGHLDVILPPEQAADLKQLVSVFGRLGTAQQIAGNPSGTGQAVMSAQQLMRIAHPLATGSLEATALPFAVSQFVTSPVGINLLQRGVVPEVTDIGVRALGQGASQTLGR